MNRLARLQAFQHDKAHYNGVRRAVHAGRPLSLEAGAGCVTAGPDTTTEREDNACG